MNCDCKSSDKKKKFSILKGKENLLKLIRGISSEETEGPSEDNVVDAVIKTETLPEEQPTQDDTFEQSTEIEDSDIIEDEIEIKRLKYILDSIEKLRYNADNPQMLEI